MELSPLYQVIVLGSLTLVGVGIVAAMLRVAFVLPRKRKAFLIKEMGHSLTTREKIFGSEVINHCRTILHNIDLHCHMREGFKMVYTYGTFEIGVNWYPINGLFEFTFPEKYETIAKIYYPT